MVSLKKIGAIATGALFIGATVGMASAVTVPSDFKASMLADNGVAKAQLVVGKDAPGKDADTASAEIIAEAVKSKLAYTVPGGDIKISYGKDNLDDKGGDDYFDNGTTTLNKIKLSGYDGKFLKFKDDSTGSQTGLMFDADGNGKLSDDADYVLYNELYVYDALANDIKLVYRPGFNAEGDVKKIRGVKYAWTRNVSSSEIKIAPAKEKTLMKYSSPNKDYADPLVGDWSVQFVFNQTGDNKAYIYFFQSGSYQGSVDVTSATGATMTDITNDAPSDFKNSYYIWVNNSANNTLAVVAASKADEISISDGQSDVLGYAKAKVDTNPATPVIYFMSDVISLVRDDVIDLEGTYYRLDYTGRELDIQRKSEVTVASGTKMRSDDPDYKDFLEQTVTITATGGDIKISYGKDNLDDKDGDDNFAHANGTTIGNKIKLSGYDGKFLKFKDGSTGSLTGLMFDADGNGKLSDDADYVLYNELYVYDALANDIKLVYRPGFNAEGDVKKIRGVKYAWTRNVSSSEIKIAPAKEKTLMKYSSPNKDYADPLVGDWSVQFVFNQTGDNKAYIYFFQSGSYQGSVDVTSATGATMTDITNDAPSDFKNSYYIWVNNSANNTLAVVAASKADEISISDGQSDVLGYAKAKVDTNPATPVIYFMSDVISLVRDDVIDLEGTYYRLDYTGRELDIQRKSEVTVASGTKMRSDDPNYKDFLRQTVTMTATGEETLTPELEIVNEDTADKNKNLVLIGGPVANKLTADLVNAGKSKVDWYTSAGDIEVIADAFGTGTYGIIVAGKTRAETAAAAQALADAL
jgi:hypothetical protein